MSLSDQGVVHTKMKRGTTQAPYNYDNLKIILTNKSDSKHTILQFGLMEIRTLSHSREKSRGTAILRWHPPDSLKARYESLRMREAAFVQHYGSQWYWLNFLEVRGMSSIIICIDCILERKWAIWARWFNVKRHILKKSCAGQVFIKSSASWWLFWITNTAQRM